MSIRGGGMSAPGIFAFFYIKNLYGVVVFHRSIVDWRREGVHLPWVGVHPSICKTYLV